MICEDVRDIVNFVLLFAPLYAYAIGGVIVFAKTKKQWFTTLDDEVPDERNGYISDKRKGRITLAGLCFAALAFVQQMRPLLPEPYIDRYEYCVTRIPVPLGVGIGSFILAYMVLRHGKKAWADYLSDGLMDLGLWCILASLMLIYVLGPPYELVRTICAVVLVCFYFIIVLNLVESLRRWLNPKDGKSNAPPGSK